MSLFLRGDGLHLRYDLSLPLNEDAVRDGEDLGQASETTKSRETGMWRRGVVRSASVRLSLMPRLPSARRCVP